MVTPIKKFRSALHPSYAAGNEVANVGQVTGFLPGDLVKRPPGCVNSRITDENDMKFGIACMLTDESIRPADLAVAAEERSFDSLFTGEHSHVPASRETPFPFGGDLPHEFYRELDSFVTG